MRAQGAHVMGKEGLGLGSALPRAGRLPWKAEGVRSRRISETAFVSEAQVRSTRE